MEKLAQSARERVRVRRAGFEVLFDNVFDGLSFEDFSRSRDALCPNRLRNRISTRC